jgi:hypothetical protein
MVCAGRIGAKMTDDRSEADTYDLEDPPSNCTRCGAPVAEEGGSLCVACGFDTTSREVSGTQEGVKDAPRETVPEPIVSATTVRPWLIIAAISVVLLVVAWLAGWGSLFPHSGGKFLDSSDEFSLASPPILARLLGVLRWIVAGVTLTLVGALALRLTGLIFGRRAGPTTAVISRMALVVATAGLATLVPIEIRWLEVVVQLLLGVGLVALGSVVVLRLKGSQLGIFLISWCLMMAALLPLARLVAWSF